MNEGALVLGDVAVAMEDSAKYSLHNFVAYLLNPG